MIETRPTYTHSLAADLNEVWPSDLSRLDVIDGQLASTRSCTGSSSKLAPKWSVLLFCDGSAIAHATNAECVSAADHTHELQP